MTKAAGSVPTETEVERIEYRGFVIAVMLALPSSGPVRGSWRVLQAEAEHARGVLEPGGYSQDLAIGKCIAAASERVDRLIADNL
jgi:hypothetical protein